MTYDTDFCVVGGGMARPIRGYFRRAPWRKGSPDARPSGARRQCIQRVSYTHIVLGIIPEVSSRSCNFVTASMEKPFFVRVAAGIVWSSAPLQ